MEKGVIHLDANGPPASTSSSKELLTLLGAEQDDIFTPTFSSAEAIAQVLFSAFLEISRKTGKCHFVISTIEDAPTLQMMKRLEDLGCFVKIAPITNRGEIDLQTFESLISARTALVSITMAQGLTGVIQPTDEIAAICQKKNVLLHLDATHAFGKIHISMHSDYLTFSQGILSRKGVPLVPLIPGRKAYHSLSLPESIDEISLEMPRLRYFFEQEILKNIPDSKVLLKESLRLPNTTVITFPFAHQDALYHILKAKNIHTLVGGETSQHLSALLPYTDSFDASCALSFSLSPSLTQEELKKAAQEIKNAVETLREISPPIMSSYPLTTHSLQKTKVLPFRYAGILSEVEGMRLAIGEEKSLILSLLVDETDGEIADAKFQAFGPLSLLKTGETLSQLVIRKDIAQASRMTAEIIEKELKEKVPDTFLNQALSALDTALEKCSDIQCKSSVYEETPIHIDLNGEGLENWEEFAHIQKLKLIEEVIDKEIRPYIELDAGGIEVIELKENDEVLISYQGACTTCPSATGSTLNAIQNILNARLSKTIIVIPQF